MTRYAAKISWHSQFSSALIVLMILIKSVRVISSTVYLKEDVEEVVVT